MNSHLKHHRVYFVECKGLIKIGSTISTVKQRIAYMQSGNPFIIKGLGTIECDCSRKRNRPGAKCSREDEIQSMFKSQKVKWRVQDVSGFTIANNYALTSRKNLNPMKSKDIRLAY